MALPEREQAALLDGLLRYDPRLTPRQRERLVASIMSHPLAPSAPSVMAAAHVLLRPGVVQAETLAVNYALLLSLVLSGSLQYSALPMQAVLLTVNYLVLTSLMMALSLLCLVHAMARVELRHVYRALVVAMGVTGAFGMLESVTVAAPWPLATPLKLLFLVMVPLVSALIALMSVTHGDAQPRGVSLNDTAPEPPALEETTRQL
jgi:hypothetical protein